MEWLIALIALTAMEIVLGIDNIVFIAIVTGTLPAAHRPAARRLGLVLALVMRLALLCGIKWVMSLTEPVFQITSLGFSATRPGRSMCRFWKGCPASHGSGRRGNVGCPCGPLRMVCGPSHVP